MRKCDPIKGTEEICRNSPQDRGTCELCQNILCKVTQFTL